MKNIIVTGGAGFIGSNFVIYMLQKYNDIKIINLDKLTYAGNLENLKSVQDNKNYVFVQGDICDRELVDRLFKEYNVTHVINFAAESHVDRSIADPDIFIKTNVGGTANLLNIARKYWEVDGKYKEGVKYLQVSTDEVYGSLGETGFFTETTPLDPHSPYSASKAGGDLIVKAYADTYGMPVNITRCSNNYGPYQFPEKLIPLMINNALSKKPLPVYGDGKNIRDWLYVEDHCSAIDMVLHNGKPGEIYNIGGHNERENIQIVKTIIGYLREHVDSTIDENLIKYVEDRKGHDRRYGIDPEKIKRELGWYPVTTFEVGIEKTIKWYLDNKEWMDNITSGEYQNYYKSMYEKDV
ncbi:MAG TPA: dTDP-glucose 4,6-dehydratase [Pseudobacteroides sp.]|nr:dTDP-glucose 4,6-dehydratase [Pseudobacteroides sp.]